jgi:hypothetical protein
VGGDERGEGRYAQGGGEELERRDAGADEGGGGGAEEEPPGAARRREGVERAEAGEEVPQHLRQRQLRQVRPVAERVRLRRGSRHRKRGGGGRAGTLRVKVAGDFWVVGTAVPLR